MMKNKNKTGKQDSCEGFKKLVISSVKREGWGETPHVFKELKDEEVHLLFSLLSTHRKQRQVAARGSVEGILPGGWETDLPCYPGRMQDHLAWTVFFFERQSHLKKPGGIESRTRVDALQKFVQWKTKTRALAFQDCWMTSLLGKGVSNSGWGNSLVIIKHLLKISIRNCVGSE